MKEAQRTVIVMAKAPVAGRVKTRLCPPLTPMQAAAVAAAALTDTLLTVSNTPGVRRVLALWGSPVDLGQIDTAGWVILPQRGSGLAARLVHAFADAQAARRGPVVLVGMDTPQLRVDHLQAAFKTLHDSDAVIGPADDGGWWLLGLRRPSLAMVLHDVPMSTEHTGSLTASALRARGQRLAELELLTDVDTADDAMTVAASVPDSHFGRAWRTCGVVATR